MTASTKTPPVILRRQQVEARTGLSRSTIYAKLRPNPKRPYEHDPSLSNAIAEFKNCMAAAGIEPPETIKATGKIERFPGNGKRGDDAAWYVFFDDGIPAGRFGDWRNDVDVTWSSGAGRALTPKETRHHHERMERARAAATAEKKQSESHGGKAVERGHTGGG